ncbi:MAG TPA: hypothetical protein VE569_00505 [Acidimicrobiia bacterium]|jgi:hypothetical protein|nr:hypothetical protein [Acidimicrobiia bacterium]
MFQKTIAILSTLLVGLLVAGIAWAHGDDPISGSASVKTASEASVDDGRAAVETESETSAHVEAESSTSTTTSSTSTSTTVDDPEPSSTTLDNDTTSTTVPSSERPQDGPTTYKIPGVGTVTIDVRAGVLVLVDVSAPGWSVELDKVEGDRIEIEFFSGETEAEFEIRMEGPKTEVGIEVDSEVDSD